MPLVLIGALAAGLVWGLKWYSYAGSHEETDNCTVAAHLYAVSSKVAGSVREVLVKDNAFVKTGQPLVRLDPTDFELNLRRARAALEVSRSQSRTSMATIEQARENTRAQLRQARGNVTGSRAGLDALAAAIDEARAGVAASTNQAQQVKANLDKAEADERRALNLYRQEAISAQQFDTARSASLALAAQYRQAQDQIVQSRSRLQQAQDNLRRAQALLEVSQGAVSLAQVGEYQVRVNQGQYQSTLASAQQAALNLEDARNQLSYTRINAPAEGYVGRRSVEPGQRLQPGQTLISLVSSEIWLIANFKESQLSRIRPGEAVEIHLDAYPDKVFSGRVDSISPGTGSLFALLPPDNATGNFTKVVQRVPVKIVFDPASLGDFRPRIAPGMSASVSVAVAQPPARQWRAQAPQIHAHAGR